MFQTYLQEKKELILTYLHEFLKLQKPIVINRWGSDAIERLEQFMQNGKMIRGTLVFLGYDLSEKKEHSDLIKIASAMELFQAGLLIHDDIMDHDELRRGKPSMHNQYKQMFQKQGSNSPKDTAVSFALCIGDLAYFYAYELLASIKHPEISKITSESLSRVAQAQMQDIHFGSSEKLPTKEEILALYHYKTGDYSITLPMTLGALLSGASEETIRHINLFGKNLGIAFQLIDDRLNLFGDSLVSGKPVGSDILEKKKTLYYYLISQTPEGRELVQSKNIDDIKVFCMDSGIDTQITKQIEFHTREAKEAIFHIPLPSTIKTLINDFIEYLTHRTK